MISPALLAALMQAKGQMQPSAAPQTGRPMPMGQSQRMGRPQPSPAGVLPDLMGQASQMRQGAYSTYGNAIGAAPPSPTKAFGLGDAATLGIAGLIGKLLFRSTDEDLAQLGSGYMGAKQQQAGQTDEYNMRRYQAQNQQAQLEFQRQMGEAEGVEKRGEYARGRADQLADKKAQRKYEEDQARARAKVEWDKQQEMTRRAMIRDPKVVEYWKSQGKTEAGRVELAIAVRGKDPDAIEAARQLSESEKNLKSIREERDAMLPGKLTGQGYDNERKRIEVEYLPESLRGKINLTNSQIEKNKVWVENYPAHLRMQLERLGIYLALSQSTIADRDLDNRAKLWESKNKPTVDARKSELDQLLKDSSALGKEIADLTADGDTEGANEVAQRRSRITSRIAAIRNELKQIGDSAPFAQPNQPSGVVQPPPTGMVNLPKIPDPGGFDKSGGAKALTPAEIAANKKNSKFGPVDAGNLQVIDKPKPGTAKTATTTKKPIAKDTKKPVRLKNGWGT